MANHKKDRTKEEKQQDKEYRKQKKTETQRIRRAKKQAEKQLAEEQEKVEPKASESHRQLTRPLTLRPLDPRPALTAESTPLPPPQGPPPYFNLPLQFQLLPHEVRGVEYGLSPNPNLLIYPLLLQPLNPIPNMHSIEALPRRANWLLHRHSYPALVERGVLKYR